MRLLALSLVLALVACGGKSKLTATPAPTPDPAPATVDPTPGAPTAGGPRPTPSDAELDRMFGQTLDFFDDLAAAIEANAGDCKKIATAIGGVFDRHDAMLTEAKAYKGNEEVNEKADVYMTKHKDRLEGALARMDPGMTPCKDDPDVQAVMQRLADL